MECGKIEPNSEERMEINRLKEILFKITHHSGAIEEYRDLWEPIVHDWIIEKEELQRKIYEDFFKNNCLKM